MSLMSGFVDKQYHECMQLYWITENHTHTNIEYNYHIISAVLLPYNSFLNMLTESM